ncbi:MAG: ribosome silencing factor [Rhodospirillaceae bacterium]|nr:ribosome silencing factor [Rhodospirillaceae bacterium]
MVIPQKTTNPPTIETAKALLKKVETSLEDDKAINAVVIELSGKSDIADYMVVASGTSQRHVASIADHLRENIKKSGVEKVAVEGLNQSDWVLVDCGDVIVHVFRPDVREFYNLEKMWSSAPKSDAKTVGANV